MYLLRILSRLYLQRYSRVLRNSGPFLFRVVPLLFELLLSPNTLINLLFLLFVCRRCLTSVDGKPFYGTHRCLLCSTYLDPPPFVRTRRPNSVCVVG